LDLALLNLNEELKHLFKTYPNSESMNKNVGSTDKIIRLVIALVLVGLYYAGTITGTWGIVALVAAVILAVTSLVNFCPLYTILGINSAPKSKAK
jgi:hypothetical protein